MPSFCSPPSGAPSKVEADCKSRCCPGDKGIASETCCISCKGKAQQITGELGSTRGEMGGIPFWKIEVNENNGAVLCSRGTHCSKLREDPANSTRHSYHILFLEYGSSEGSVLASISTLRTETNVTGLEIVVCIQVSGFSFDLRQYLIAVMISSDWFMPLPATVRILSTTFSY